MFKLLSMEIDIKEILDNTDILMTQIKGDTYPKLHYSKEEWIFPAQGQNSVKEII